MRISTAQPILVTGTAGFIGFHLARRLLAEGQRVIGIDNVNDYYDPRLKRARLALLEGQPGFRQYEIDLADKPGVQAVFADHRPEFVINLAAQAGVRYSITNPDVYVHSNVQGFLNVLEACRHTGVKHLVYASSSSVYGANTAMPFSIHQNVDHPLALYGATKKANELMAHAYSNLFDLPTTGLRFFTVYGPWGRPDMAMFLFARAILAGQPIDVFNHGRMLRDFTYVDDIVEGVYRVTCNIARPNQAWSGAAPDPGTSRAPYRIYNIGNNSPVKLEYLIDVLEAKLGVKAVRNYLPLQMGDVPETYADVADLERDVGFRPSTPIEVGVGRFVDWYRSYYPA